VTEMTPMELAIGALSNSKSNVAHVLSTFTIPIQSITTALLRLRDNFGALDNQRLSLVQMRNALVAEVYSVLQHLRRR
jgi:hypothetical protein